MCACRGRGVPGTHTRTHTHTQHLNSHLRQSALNGTSLAAAAMAAQHPPQHLPEEDRIAASDSTLSRSLSATSSSTSTLPSPTTVSRGCSSAYRAMRKEQEFVSDTAVVIQAPQHEVAISAKERVRTCSVSHSDSISHSILTVTPAPEAAVTELVPPTQRRAQQATATAPQQPPPWPQQPAESPEAASAPGAAHAPALETCHNTDRQEQARGLGATTPRAPFSTCPPPTTGHGRKQAGHGKPPPSPKQRPLAREPPSPSATPPEPPSSSTTPRELPCPSVSTTPREPLSQSTTPREPPPAHVHAAAPFAAARAKTVSPLGADVQFPAVTPATDVSPQSHTPPLSPEAVHESILGEEHLQLPSDMQQRLQGRTRPSDALADHLRAERQVRAALQGGVDTQGVESWSINSNVSGAASASLARAALWGTSVTTQTDVSAAPDALLARHTATPAATQRHRQLPRHNASSSSLHNASSSSVCPQLPRQHPILLTPHASPGDDSPLWLPPTHKAFPLWHETASRTVHTGGANLLASPPMSPVRISVQTPWFSARNDGACDRESRMGAKSRLQDGANSAKKGLLSPRSWERAFQGGLTSSRIALPLPAPALATPLPFAPRTDNVGNDAATAGARAEGARGGREAGPSLLHCKSLTAPRAAESWQTLQTWRETSGPTLVSPRVLRVFPSSPLPPTTHSSPFLGIDAPLTSSSGSEPQDSSESIDAPDTAAIPKLWSRGLTPRELSS
eukprot:Tamp_04657.p1 GENE.Tamp_04657~~Tamp_04657.p1  ORF type:complete len:738 (+),score=54.12 Tamp_04657:584-2797(+)